ncbi:MAG: restriction endonuclease subunit S [Anaerolineales bacterium]|nr:restriction endonuclease subunit S [Anaerolineales bacterium]
MKWKTVKLSDVAQAIRGVTFSSGEAEPQPFYRSIACLTTSGVQEEVNWPSRRFIPLDRVKQEKQKLKYGDILVSTANSKELVGKSSFVDSLPFSSTFGAFVTVVRPNQNVVPYYLAKWMKTAEFLNSCYVACSNTTNISNLRVSELMAFEMPLPPLPEQQRIAGILARADRLRQLRRYALQLSDGYLQSVFLQMFGDPVTNPMGWEIRPLGKLLTTIDSGVSPVCQDRPALDNEWGILKLGAVTTCDYLQTENKAITSKTSPRTELEVKSGDLLFSRKNTYDLVGACAYVHHTRPKLMLPDLIFRLQIEDKKELAPIYLWQLLIFPTKRKMVQRLAGGSAGSMPNISKGRLNTVEIPLPPPELQSKFVCAVRQFERLRAQQREAARQAENLFSTLLHRAFRGEL